MSIARTRALRGLQSALRSSSARATPRVSRTHLAAGRRYASGEAHAPKSDLPWLIGAIVVTIPSCWYLWPSSSHADAGHHGSHDEHHDEHHDEGEGEHEEKTEEDAPQEDAASGQEASAEDSSSSQDDGPPSGAEGEGQDTTPDANKESARDEEAQPKEGGSPDRTGKGNVKEDSDAASETRKREPDGKGGYKKRIDSGLQKDLGASEEKFDEKGRETTATSKPPVEGSKGSKGEITSKQAGLSNTSTRHSTQIDQDPDKSKKGEGVPDTAKSMGTVDPQRPQK